MLYSAALFLFVFATFKSKQGPTFFLKNKQQLHMVSFSLMAFIFIASLVIATGTIVSDHYFKTSKIITTITGILFLGALWFTYVQSISATTPFLQMMVTAVFLMVTTFIKRLSTLSSPSQVLVSVQPVEPSRTPRVKVKPKLNVSETVYQTDTGGKAIHQPELVEELS